MPVQKDIPVLKRAMRVLEAVTARGKVTTKELSMDLEIPQATCYRIFRSLTEANLLCRDDGGYYHLSFGISRLGWLAAGMASVIAKVQEPLADYRRETGLSVKISVREDLDWLLLARSDIPRGIPLPQAAGARAPVVVGSVGAALLSQYDEKELEQILQRIPPRVWRRYDPDKVRADIAGAVARPPGGERAEVRVSLFYGLMVGKYFPRGGSRHSKPSAAEGFVYMSGCGVVLAILI